MQHLAAEEPDITSVALGPGRVDTDMQKDIREQGAIGGMHPEMHAEFVDAFHTGRLNPPEKPGEVIAKLALEAESPLSGSYVKLVHRYLIYCFSTSTCTNRVAGTTKTWRRTIGSRRWGPGRDKCRESST